MRIFFHTYEYSDMPLKHYIFFILTHLNKFKYHLKQVKYQPQNPVILASMMLNLVSQMLILVLRCKLPTQLLVVFRKVWWIDICSKKLSKMFEIFDFFFLENKKEIRVIRKKITPVIFFVKNLLILLVIILFF